MPSVKRQSGPEFTNRNGEHVKPLAIINSCEDCGYTHAAFGMWDGKDLVSYCGWRDGNPVCIGKGEK